MGYKEMCWHSPGLTSSGIFLLAIGIITLAGGGLLLTLVEYANWLPRSCHVYDSKTYGPIECDRRGHMSGKCYGAWWDVIAYELDTNKTIGNEVIKIVDFLSEADAKDQLQVHPIGSTNMCYEQTGTSKWLEDWVWSYTADPKKKLANGLILGGGIGAGIAFLLVALIWVWTRNLKVQYIDSSDEDGEVSPLIRN